MDVKIIKTRKDYNEAIARLSALMSRDPAPQSDEENELELLALVIEDFERRTVAPINTDPVEAILFRMDQMQLTRKDLIPYLGSMSKVSEVIARKRPLSLSMIRRVHEGLGIPLESLIPSEPGDGGKRDAEINLTELDYSRFPLKEMLDRGYFGDVPGGIRTLKDRATEIIGDFIGKLAPDSMKPALLRAPLHQRGARRVDEMALFAWRLCVLRKARERVPPQRFEPGTISPAWLREVAKLSAFDEGPRLAMEYLDRYGLTLVVEKHFDRTFLDGAAMLDDGRPVVALTLRHDRLDNFWFVLLHELAHVGSHLTPQQPVFLDDLEARASVELEREADALAQEALIPEAQWRKATVRTTRTEKDAISFAHSIGVHPAVVAGRLRYEQKNYRLLPKLVGSKGQVSRLLILD